MQSDRSSTATAPAPGYGRASRIVSAWLAVGVFLVFMQIVIGGITRLTGSGLSITKWEIITGTLPPLNAAEWETAFELYQSTPQYQKLNEGMRMGQFKFIYFWEYFHRVWARMMGFVFIIPFLIFWRRKWISPPLMRRLGVVILLAGLAASFGWIMVASGLVDRPWVNAYKLALHLSIALALYSYLFWTMLKTALPFPQVFHSPVLKRWALRIGVVLAVQIVLGGIMSGMKAGINFPTWPEMNGEWIPSVLLDLSNWNGENFVAYDQHVFMPALVQFVHRGTAYLLTIIVLWFSYLTVKHPGNASLKPAVFLVLGSISLEVLLGIWTVIRCLGTVPVGLGVLHQAGAILLLSAVLFLNYQVSGRPK
ncbi:MAG: COX15/CtaA family protein [Haliscomenobacter sp.]|nr:COX15/CtaA family protein [Haliscomenobacter sp.]